MTNEKWYLLREFRPSGTENREYLRKMSDEIWEMKKRCDTKRKFLAQKNKELLLCFTEVMGFQGMVGPGESKTETGRCVFVIDPMARCAAIFPRSPLATRKRELPHAR